MPSTVLIVEDAESGAEALEIALLALPGVSVHTARTGQQAWKILQEQPVSAIITDLNMPQMDGFELIERVRSRAMGVPIIVVSGSTDPEAPHRVRCLGANAFFSKPYSPAAVRDTLERLLHESSHRNSP